MTEPKPAVLISIRPKWVELIASGRKTLEIRKSRPVLEPPFTCYLYCTMGRYEDRVSAKSERLWNEWRGRVIGAFTCGGITHYRPGSDFDENRIIFSLRICSCLTVQNVWAYSDNGKKSLYGWSVKDLHVYETPLDLSAFRDLRGESVKRAPQSWMYVKRQD